MSEIMSVSRSADHTAHRIHNFSAGPATLPQPVLQQVKAELLDYQGTGMSVMEMSHRSKVYESLILQVENDLRNLLAIPANYKVLFLQGGASLQFAMIPMNLRPAGASADYIVNGAWGKAAVKEAKKLGAVRVVATTESTNFDRTPDLASVDHDPQAAYLHYTTNETIHGVQFFDTPEAPEAVPLVCDMSSDFISRPVDVARYGLIYAGAQKNAGPAGVTIVILRADLLKRVPENLPSLLNFQVLTESGSMYNTPPTFAIYIVGLVLRWVQSLGGLAAIFRLNQEKANLIYSAIDASGGFYRGHAQPDSRSLMNVTFRLPNEALEKQFAKEAEQQELSGLKGHRSVGGLRASLYNALPLESVEALAAFMAEFQRKNG